MSNVVALRKLSALVSNNKQIMPVTLHDALSQQIAIMRGTLCTNCGEKPGTETCTCGASYCKDCVETPSVFNSCKFKRGTLKCTAKMCPACMGDCCFCCGKIMCIVCVEIDVWQYCSDCNFARCHDCQKAAQYTCRVCKGFLCLDCGDKTDAECRLKMCEKCIAAEGAPAKSGKRKSPKPRVSAHSTRIVGGGVAAEAANKKKKSKKAAATEPWDVESLVEFNNAMRQNDWDWRR